MDEEVQLKATHQEVWLFFDGRWRGRRSTALARLRNWLPERVLLRLPSCSPRHPTIRPWTLLVTLLKQKCTSKKIHMMMPAWTHLGQAWNPLTCFSNVRSKKSTPAGMLLRGVAKVGCVLVKLTETSRGTCSARGASLTYSSIVDRKEVGGCIHQTSMKMSSGSPYADAG